MSINSRKRRAPGEHGVGRLIYQLTGKRKPYEEYFNCHDLDYGFCPCYLNPPKNTPSIAAGLDGDEFGIVGASPTINSCHNACEDDLKYLKEPEKAFLSVVSSVVLQQSLLNLDTAFTNFFEKRAKDPKFKSRRDRQTARYATNAFTFRNGRITLAKQSEPLDIVWSRPLPDDAKIINELEYKAAWYGRTYLELDRFFPSSKLCSSCGHLPEGNGCHDPGCLRA